MYSVVIPVYRNAESIPALLAELAELDRELKARAATPLEAVFVVDGSPDDSFAILSRILPSAPFASQLLLHSRNFGAFAAIRTGLEAAAGEFVGVMAADLQEPAMLQASFHHILAQGGTDVVVGTRAGRDDPFLSRLASSVFWRSYSLLINRDVPKGGVDIFGCTRQFRDLLVRLRESNSSLVALIYWLGFRRAEVAYHRRARRHGRSAWSFRRKLAYMMDSIYAFTDLPVRILLGLGALGTVVSIVLGAAVLASRFYGGIAVPGYAATILTILFFGALNMFGLGIIGTYTVRAYENTKGRPLAIVMHRQSWPPAGPNPQTPSGTS